MNAETTNRYAFETLAFLDEAVYFSHLAQCNFRPSLLLDDCLNLLTKRLNILRVCCEVEECMSEALSRGVNQASLGCSMNSKRTWEDV